MTYITFIYNIVLFLVFCVAITSCFLIPVKIFCWKLPLHSVCALGVVNTCKFWNVRLQSGHNSALLTVKAVTPFLTANNLI